MKKQNLLLSAALLVFLSPVPQRPVTEFWSKQELQEVFDLTELGRVSRDVAGHFLLGGKRIRPEETNHISYGRRRNLLRLEDKVLNLLPNQVLDALFEATPRQLHVYMQQYDIPMSLFHSAQGQDFSISLQEFKPIAARILQKTNDPQLKPALQNILAMPDTK